MAKVHDSGILIGALRRAEAYSRDRSRTSSRTRSLTRSLTRSPSRSLAIRTIALPQPPWYEHIISERSFERGRYLIFSCFSSWFYTISHFLIHFTVSAVQLQSLNCGSKPLDDDVLAELLPGDLLGELLLGKLLLTGLLNSLSLHASSVATAEFKFPVTYWQ